jgi:hypothetical protein
LWVLHGDHAIAAMNDRWLFAETHQLLNRHRATLEHIARALLDHGTVGAAHVRALVAPR